MRLAYLFLKSRRAGWTTLYLMGIAAFVAGLRLLAAEMDSRGRDPFTNSFDGSPVSLVFLFVPLASALVIGVGIHAPFGELERAVSRPLPPLRLGHLAGLFVCGAAMLLLLALIWQGDAGYVFLRNLAGFAGLALLTAPLTGARLSWLLPFAYGVTAFWMGASSEAPPWAWPLQPAEDSLSLVIALALLASGLAVAALLGARESSGEAE